MILMSYDGLDVAGFSPSLKVQNFQHQFDSGQNYGVFFPVYIWFQILVGLSYMPPDQQLRGNALALLQFDSNCTIG